HEDTTVEHQAVGGGDAADHAACPVVRVFGDVLGRIDASGGHVGESQCLERFADLVHAGPCRDGRVDLGDAGDAAGVARQSGIGAEVVAADGLHQPPED